jgi:hypothetical protein
MVYIILGLGLGIGLGLGLGIGLGLGLDDRFVDKSFRVDEIYAPKG